MNSDETRLRTKLGQPAVVMAPRLLGASLVSDLGGARVAIRLTEVEAYEGANDPAAHGYKGMTTRNAVVFGPAGHLYCYFIYGMHWCSNVVCGVEGISSAVLLRAGEIVEGHDVARARRPPTKRDSELARGPARLSLCLGLAAAVNGLDLLDPASPVRLEGVRSRPLAGVLSGPRIGINVATEFPWRFWLAGDPTVSAFKAGGQTRPRRQEAG